MNKLKEIDFSAYPSPAYICDEHLLRRNLEILADVQDRANCKILLALKGFAMFGVFPIIKQYLKGVTASSLFEARLGREEMNGEVHTYAAAYSETEFPEILKYSDHIVFNSFSQWKKYRYSAMEYNKTHEKSIDFGIRINPEYSEIKTPIYNPCYINSRLGVTLANFEPEELSGISGIHFHTHCEQNSDSLSRGLPHIYKKFGEFIKKMKWLNFGGGHHITRSDYDIETLLYCIKFAQDKYGVDVYLEPGEAIALGTGYLVSTVLDILKNNMKLAIMDASAAAHMPDVIEMPYRPHIIGSGMPNEFKFTYRLGGQTCLAGDIIGDYSFKEELMPGDRLVFTDMAHYTMVKNNMFNGVNLPAICLFTEDKKVKVLKEFNYYDYKNRLS